MTDKYEMAVALVCSAGHREATLKSHYSNFGLGSRCSICWGKLEVEREALVRVRDMDESRNRHVIYRK